MTGVSQAKVLQFHRTGEEETTIGDKVALVPLPVRFIPGMAQTFSIVYGSYEETVSTETPQFQVFSYSLPSGSIQEKEVSELRDRVRTLEDRLAAIEKDQDSRVVLLRAISREDAKNEILRLFEENHTDVFDYGIIAERLQLDLQIVVDICNDLEREGLIG